MVQVTDSRGIMVEASSFNSYNINFAFSSQSSPAQLCSRTIAEWYYALVRARSAKCDSGATNSSYSSGVLAFMSNWFDFGYSISSGRLGIRISDSIRPDYQLYYL